MSNVKYETEDAENIQICLLNLLRPAVLGSLEAYFVV